MAALTADFTPESSAPRRPPASPAGPTIRPGRAPRWGRLHSAPSVRPAPGLQAPATTARRRRERQRVLRRRRLVALVLVAVLAFVAGVFLALALMSVPAGGSLTEEAKEARRVTYVVQPGDTLWRAAQHLAPGADPRAVVDALSSARGTTEVLPGEQLVWPLD